MGEEKKKDKDKCRKCGAELVAGVCEVCVQAEKDMETLGEMRPYPNEHACRLEDPGKYDRFARKNCNQKHEEKCMMSSLE